ncbi:MAG: tetratricopeptide repeat protein [Gemmatimonadetes bacterium]|nr:tetratricopeptide repeat protein [Gemmatimonadota bacterium]
MRDDVASVIERARAAEHAGRTTEARLHFERAFSMMRTEASAGRAASILRWIGSTHRAEGNGAAARDCFRASLAVARAKRDRRDQAHALNWLGIVNQDRGRLDAADRWFEAAARAARRARDARIFAMVQQNLGINCNIRGDLAAALRHYRGALASYQRLGEARYTAQVQNVLGMLYTDLRRWHAAERAFEKSAALCVETDELHTYTMVEVNRAELFFMRGEIERARAACDRALVLAGRAGRQSAFGEVYRWYGAIHRESGDHAASERVLLDAMRIAREHDMQLLEAEAHRELALLYRRMARNREALQALFDSRRIFTELRARRDLAELGRRLEELETQFEAVVREWGESIDAKDRYTHGHCTRVAAYATALASRLGFADDVIQWFRMGAYLHDVGKTVVPLEVLNKPGRLTDGEFAIMKQHTVAGDAIVAGLNFPWDIRPIVRSHHERVDGKGYPDGLKGQEIPLSARVLCVADVFDALTTTRSYRPAMSVQEALAVMQDSEGTQLDAGVFRAFLGLIRERAFPELVVAA